MRRSFSIAVFMCLLWSWAEPLRAQTHEISSRDLIRALQTPLDLKDLQNPMALKEALEAISKHVANSGVLGKVIDLPILIDHQAFKDAAPEAPDLYEGVVKFPPHAKTMTVGAALQFALAQAGEATYFIRRGCIEVVPAKQDRLPVLLRRKVIADFDKKPLSEAIHELAEQTGLSVVMDARVKEKLASPVTALLRGDTELRYALLVLTDMADLKVVELPAAVYVTSAANAEALEKAFRAKQANATAK